MDYANLPRLRRRPDRFWLTVGLCALTAALIFLPFQIIDGGFFHYAGDFNGQQIGFYLSRDAKTVLLLPDPDDAQMRVTLNKNGQVRIRQFTDALADKGVRLPARYGAEFLPEQGLWACELRYESAAEFPATPRRAKKNRLSAMME